MYIDGLYGPSNSIAMGAYFLYLHWAHRQIQEGMRQPDGWTPK